jgi:natural product biosynthesis luciferase-like monooxygenase protein
MTEPASGSEIAIIGIAGRFPGAGDVAALWRNLRAGVESITRFTDAELESSSLLPGLREHPDFVPAGGVLDGADQFDHAFFGFSPREARWLDPQQRLFLQTAWAALEDAGYDPARSGGRIAVYAGAGSSGHLLGLLGELTGDPASQYQALGTATSENLATRVAFQLGLRGEAVTIHTACSTGLAAVHLACQSLLLGQSRLALAGAVRVSLPQRTGYRYQEGMILSRDGHCRAFDHRASGTVAGNGVGVVVLKPLADALADGDQVYAVIRGSALNNDGHRGVGYTAPSVAGQAEVIAEALAFAGISAAEIGYVEAHGTGTPLGDPIEIEALTRAYRRTTDRVGDCPIGSIKTNLGHLDTAAGIAGLIKVVQMLRYGEIPPSLHLEAPNPAIDFASGPFVVNTELRPWPGGDGPRSAGVSSFGIGGTNVHAVLGQAPAAAPAAPSPRPHQLVTLAARSRPALARMAGELADHLRGPAAGAELADVAYTRAVGRAEFAYRRSYVAATAAELAACLRAKAPEHPAATGTPQVAFLFPGQGVAHYGMAAQLHQCEPVFRDALATCLAAIEPLLAQPLLPALCEGSGPIEDPELSHPALFAVEYALAQLWLAWGVRPAALLGHSFGEYAAACVAGVLTLPDAAALTVTRGRLVARLPEGRMLAVALGEDQLEPWLAGAAPGELSLAAVNGDERCVVSGPVEAVTRLRERLADARQAAVLLPVRHAFHSPAVEPVLAELAGAAAGFRYGEPELPLLSSLTGDVWTEQPAGGDYWASQMREPVRFAAALERLAGAGGPDDPLLLVEVGPDQALTALARDQLRKRATVVPSLRSRRTGDADHRVLLTGLGTLWRAGTAIDWPAYYRGERRRRVALPTYPFEPTPVERLPGAPLTGAPPATAPPTGPSTEVGTVEPAAGGSAPPAPAPADGPVAGPADGPRDEIERKVYEVWRERLEVSDLGVHDNFLELGGNSLIAAQLLTRLREVFAAPIPLSALFEAPTVAGTAARIRALAGGPDPAGGQPGAPALPPIRPTRRSQPPTLSAVQERTLAMEGADPGNPALAMPVAVVMDGVLDEALLQRAIRAVADRHETLRTTYHRDGPAWTARIEPTARVELERQVIAGGEAAAQAEAQRIARAEPARPFDLSVSPLRARLLRLADERHILLLTLHHVGSDTLSMVIVVREIAACYRAFHAGEPSPLPPLPVQYADFAAWQREQLAGAALAPQRDYWRDRLADPPPPLALPSDRPRATEAGVRGSWLAVGLPADLSTQVAQFSRALGVTPFVTLLAAYVCLLGRITGADDLLVGTPIANRDRPELEPLVGYVAHTLPLRADLRGDPRFVALVGQLNRTVLAAFANPDVPYEHVTQVAADRRLLDAVLVLHAELPQVQDLPQLTWRHWQVPQAPAMFGATLSTLTLMLAASPAGYAGNLGYADELFDAASARRLVDQFAGLLADALDRPEARLSELRPGPAPAPPAAAAAVTEPDARAIRLVDPQLPRWSPPAQRGARPLRLSLSYFADDEDALAGPKYQLLLDGARLADELGFAAVWTPERHFHRFGGLYPNPTAVSAGLATTTSRIGIRAGSVVLPLHDPIRVAEDWAVIDNLSGGRAGVSFASGWHPDDFVLAADRYAERREVLRQGIETVRRLWRGEPVRRRNGVGEEVEVRIRPRPVQAELPFWLTAAGSPHTFALAGQLGAGLLTNLMAQTLDELAEKIQIYRRAWREAGHDGGGWAGPDGHVTLMLHAFLADEAEAAYATARGPLLRYFRSSLDIARGFAVAQGMVVRPEDLSEEDIQALLEHGLDRYLHEGGLFGTPQTCAPVLEQVRALGVDEVAALIDYGTSVKDTLHSIRLLGRLVRQETQRARAAAAAATADTTARCRELARAVAARPGDPVAGSADLLGWFAETAPEALAGRTVLVTDVDPPAAVLRSLSTVSARVFVPAPELPTGSLPARWAQWLDGPELAVAPGPGAAVVDAAGGNLGVGVVGELTLAGAPTGQRARWRSDSRLDLLPGPVVRAAPVPLSYAQQRIWSLEQLAPGNIAYNNAVALRLRGRLDTAALHQALQAVVHRHAVLRTTFHAADDLGAAGSSPATPPAHQQVAVQVVHPSMDLDLPVQEVSAQEVDRLAREHARQPFALDRGPLLRVRLLRLVDTGATEHVLLICMHHIISDGWSAGVLVSELGSLYAAMRQPAGSSSQASAADRAYYPLPPLPMQYADYAVAQREQDAAGLLTAELEHWRRTLADLPSLRLPTDRPRPPVQGQRGARVPVHIDRSLTDALRGLGRATGTTPFMVLYAALTTVLHRHSGQTDVAIGTAVAGRTTPAAETLVGVFINTVVIRADLGGDPTFTQLLDRVKSTVLDALAHQEVPFERLVDALKVTRDLSQAPLCQALLVLHNTPVPRVELGELTLDIADVDAGTTKLDLTVELREVADGIRGAFEYDTELFDESTVTSLVQDLVALLADAVAAPHRRLSELALRSGGRRAPAGR